MGGQIIVAADDSSESWKDKADYHCSGADDDAVALNAAAIAAADGRERLWLAPGNYRVESCFSVGRNVEGVVGMGRATITARGDYAGVLMEVADLRRAPAEGLTLYGKNQAQGLRISGCQDSRFSGLSIVACTQALRLQSGWCTHLDRIRVSDCEGIIGLPLVELRAFSASSCRGLVIERSSSPEPMLQVTGSQAVVSEVAIERCASDESMVELNGTQMGLRNVHFEDNRAPSQVHAVGCRQSDIRSVSCGNPESNPVEIGVLLENCWDTIVDGVLVNNCRRSAVTVDVESAGCEVSRVGLHSPNPVVAPEHLVEYLGQ